MRMFRARGLSAIAVVGLLAGGVGAGHALAAGGGLSVFPGILEHVASRGGVGALKISNTTSSAMGIKIALRPWVQSRGGEVAPNRGRTLGEVRPTTSSFTLPAGSSRSVGIILTRRPSGRSQYGAVEVTGAPTRRVSNGINLAYRIVNSLRLDAPKGAQSYRAEAGVLVQQGGYRHGTLLIAVRNTGNTIVPIGGKARISGQGHSLSANARAEAILPGGIVNVPLTELTGSLSKGRYTVSVALSQGGHSLGTVNRTIGLR